MLDENETIPVLIDVGPTDASAQLAITRAMRANANRNFKQQLDLCRGQRIVDTWYNDGRLCLHLSAGTSITFATFPVDSDLSDGNKTPVYVRVESMWPKPGEKYPDSPVTLSSCGHIWTWDRKEIANQLLNRIVNDLFVGPAQLFLYLDDAIILKICLLTVETKSERLLYWDVTD